MFTEGQQTSSVKSIVANSLFIALLGFSPYSVSAESIFSGTNSEPPLSASNVSVMLDVNNNSGIYLWQYTLTNNLNPALPGGCSERLPSCMIEDVELFLPSRSHPSVPEAQAVSAPPGWSILAPFVYNTTDRLIGPGQSGVFSFVTLPRQLEGESVLAIVPSIFFAGFNINIPTPGNLILPPTPPTPLPPPAKSETERAFYVGGQRALFAAAIVEIILGLATPCNGLCLGIATMETASSGLLRTFDPVDLNYTAIASPSPPAVPTLPVSPFLTSATTPVVKDLLQNLAQVIGLAKAVQISLDRANGAFVSNAPVYQQLQLNLVHLYISQERADLLKVATDLNALSTLLSTAGLPSSFIGTEQLLAFQQQLAAEGLPASEISMLQALGLSPSEIAQFTQLLAETDASTLAGIYPAKFSDLAAQLDVAASNLEPVPEPSTWLLFGSGLVGLAFARRKLAA